MKIIRAISLLVLLMALAEATRSNAQTNVFPTTGNVGIGTTTPGNKLTIIDDFAAGGYGTVIAGASGAARDIFLVGQNGLSNGFTVQYTGSAMKYSFIDGNVGIGTTGPFAKFDVEGKANVGSGTAQNTFLSTDTQLQILTDEGVAAQLGFWQSGIAAAYLGHKAFDSNFYITNAYSGAALGTADKSFTVAPGGNVGIGTTNPSAKLQVVGGGNGTVDLVVNGRMQTGDSNGNGGVWLNSAQTAFIGTEGNNSIGIFTSNGWAVTVPQSGNVGIGTTNPTQKLSVNGKIQAKEVIVQTGWSDYVFDEGYKLTALSETEAYIKAERHLPGIPSAQEVAEHGVSMGDMQSKLLAKIEELTLHVIAQEKRAVSQQNEIAALRNQLGRISNK
jgi:hypothetical protein